MGWKKNERGVQLEKLEKARANKHEAIRMAHENKSTNKVRAQTRVKRCNKA